MNLRWMAFLFLFPLNLSTTWASSFLSDIATHFSEYCSASQFSTDALLPSGNFDPYLMIKEREELMRKSLELKLYKSKQRLQELIVIQSCLKEGPSKSCQMYKKSLQDNLFVLSKIKKKQLYLEYNLYSECSEENVGLRYQVGGSLRPFCGEDIQNELTKLRTLERKIKVDLPFLDDEVLLDQIKGMSSPSDLNFMSLIDKNLSKIREAILAEMIKTKEKLDSKESLYQLAKKYKDVEFGSEDYLELEELSLYYFDDVSNPHVNARLQFAKCQMTNTLLQIENVKNMKHFGRDVGFVIASAGLGGVLTSLKVGHRAILAVDLALEAAFILKVDIPEILKYSKRCQELHEKFLIANSKDQQFDLILKHQSCLSALHSAIFMTVANPARLGIELKMPHSH